MTLMVNRARTPGAALLGAVAVFGPDGAAIAVPYLGQLVRVTRDINAPAETRSPAFFFDSVSTESAFDTSYEAYAGHYHRLLAEVTRTGVTVQEAAPLELDWQL